MADASLVDRLCAHRTIGRAPRAELEWLADHGWLARYEPGDVTGSLAELIQSLWVMLDGRMSIRVDRGAGPRKVMEWEGGDVSGLLPYSRMQGPPPGSLTIEEPAEGLRVDKSHFRELTRECPELTTILVHVMLDRARTFTSSEYHDEKMTSLGRLAAGLAHELNNPASAVVRGASALSRQIDELDDAARALGAAGPPADQLAAIDRVRVMCETDAANVGRSPVQRADREEAIDAWLDAHHVTLPEAAALAASTVTIEALDHLARDLDATTLPIALRAITASRVAHQTALEVEAAASRVHALVLAVKGFSHLDQSGAPARFEIAQGLRDSLAVMRSKARMKDISVTLEIAKDVPAIVGVPGELNQVWGNLLDNALDASPAKGQVQIVACRELDGRLVVKFIDNGPGIPEHLRKRVFDQFFTTKPIGQGTGLGLDIARRIVRSHDGAIEFETRAGRTEFRVVLPPAPSA
jgi:signal transduction histidine kinase